MFSPNPSTEAMVSVTQLLKGMEAQMGQFLPFEALVSFILFFFSGDGGGRGVVGPV